MKICTVFKNCRYISLYVIVIISFSVSTDAFGYAVPVAFMGAPTIITEKLVNGKETLSALTALRQLLASGMYESGNEDGRKSCNGVTVENIPGFEGTYKAEGYQHKKYSNVPLVSYIVKTIVEFRLQNSFNYI